LDRDHVTKEEFLLEYYGMLSRELGNPPAEGRRRYFSDNPNDIFECIQFSINNKVPAFISVQPRESFDRVQGIEKLFFDFDYADKHSVKELEARIKDPKKREAIYEKRKIDMKFEVEFFLNKLQGRRIVPLVVKTRKGFHVYIYLDQVYPLSIDNEDLLKEVYYQLQYNFMRDKKGGYKYLDNSVIGDVKRMCRIPTSVHEVSGEECFVVERIVNGNVIPAKFRGIDHFRLNGLKSSDWLRAIDSAFRAIKRREEVALKEEAARIKEMEEHKGEPEYTPEIRPCFKRRMETGEMGHQMRLALELEAYWAGYKTKEAMMELFKCFHDYDEQKTRDQVEWFFRNRVPDIDKSKRWKPYRCSTLEELNLCDKLQCPKYNRRK
jgi:hypothetical protein